MQNVLRNKKLVFKILAISLVFVACSSLSAYAATQLITNPVDLTPKLPAEATLTVSNSTPNVGDAVTFTAKLINVPNPSGQTINFKMANSTSIGTAVTDATGTAILSYTTVSTEHLVIKGYVTI